MHLVFVWPGMCIGDRDRFKRKRRSAEEDGPPVYRSVMQTVRLARFPVWPIQNGEERSQEK